MTMARKYVYRPGEAGVFHCINRCVRRAFLCGWDDYSGKSFEHRREWVRERSEGALRDLRVGCMRLRDC